LRAEADHDSISRLLYHQQLQNELLMRLAQEANVNVSDLKAAVAKLATSPT
jgi:hypothetical protein